MRHFMLHTGRTDPLKPAPWTGSDRTCAGFQIMMFKHVLITPFQCFGYLSEQGHLHPHLHPTIWWCHELESPHNDWIIKEGRYRQWSAVSDLMLFPCLFCALACQHVARLTAPSLQFLCLVTSCNLGSDCRGTGCVSWSFSEQRVAAGISPQSEDMRGNEMQQTGFVVLFII